MANQDRVNFVWAESALTTIPPIPVSEVAYRDTTQTPEQMEVGQQYDTIYNSARHNQLLFLLTSVAKTLCENGIMPFLAGQEYSQYARCIFTDGKLYTASRAILANEQPYPTPGDDSGVWIAEETNENLVPNSRRVIAGTGLTGGGSLSSDVTLSAKLTNSVSTTDSTTAASATAVKTAYDRGSAGITAAEKAQSAAATAQSTANNALSVANGKLPLSGGTLTGALRSKPGNIHVASTPRADEVDDALYLVDANGVVYANLQSTNYANGSMLVGLAVNTSVKGGSGGWQTLKIGADKTGKFISHVPTPDLSDASDNIANTVYVQENLKSYLKLAGGILTGDVTVPSVNGYQVVDHEVNGGWYFFPENFYNSGRNGRFLTKAGLKVQYGGVSGMSNVTQQVTFSEPFSTIPIVIATSESSGIEQITVPLGVTTTGFSLGHMSAGTQTGTVFKHWIAIGR